MYDIERFTITELVEKAADRYEELPALSMVGGKPLSYRELERRSLHMAAALSLLGARPGDRIGLISENKLGWGLAYFGISRAGCVAVPVLTDFTAEQTINIIEHSECRIVICSKRFGAKLRDSVQATRILDLDALYALASPGASPGSELGEILERCALATKDEFKEFAASFCPPAVSPGDLAAIVYTSGTTGRPKGVMLTHRNLMHDAWSVKFIMEIGRSDRLLSVLPLAHTYEFTVGFLHPLMQGASIYYLERLPSASVLLPVLQSLRPTVMLTVPLIIEKIYSSAVKPAFEKLPPVLLRCLRPIVEAIAGSRLKRSFGGRLRVFGIGGAPLAAEVEAFLHRIHFPCAIGYGLTETSPLAAGSSPRDFRVRSIGPAVHGTELRIVDPLPETGEGEIQVRGPHVMAGYYKDRIRSEEAMTPDGWFRTGDLGTLDAQGRLSVRGRLKTVILGPSGENIYPEDIEAVLNSSPLVAESLVYGDDRGLTALVQLKQGIPQERSARGQDDIEGEAAELSAAFLQAIGNVEATLERSLELILERIRQEANAHLAAFSRIARIRLQMEPFEKTPTQKIKRFLYPRS